MFDSKTLLLLSALAAMSAACDSSDVSRKDGPNAAAASAQYAGETQGDLEREPGGTRYIVQTGPDQAPDDVATMATDFLGADARVAPMFPGIDDAELTTFFVVSSGESVAPEVAWERARAFATAGDFAGVEPDRHNTLVPESPVARQATAACLRGDPGAPPDTAWSLRKIRVAEAWALTPPAEGKRHGEGARICHPDTGWTTHTDLDSLDLATAWNVMNNTDDARDPKNDGLLLHPGHGTATGSVIGSDGGIDATSGTTPPGLITGVAPKATLVPIRTVNSVVQLFDSDVAQAVAYSVSAQCDVISMSLGGRAFSGLKSAVRYATDNGLVVVAAAGNCVGMIVAPAAYDDTIAAAATNIDDQPWKGTSRGRAVTLAAPGENVWVADNTKDPDTPDAIRASNGTSFATAEIAGAAALWIAYHGRAAIEAATGAGRVHDLFVDIAMETARVPTGWNSRRYGAGILDVRSLLEARLDDPRAPTVAPAAPAFIDAVELLANITDRAPGEINDALQIMLDDTGDFESTANEWAPELIDIALRDPEAFNNALDEALLTSPQARDPGARLAAHNAIERMMSASLKEATR